MCVAGCLDTATMNTPQAPLRCPPSPLECPFQIPTRAPPNNLDRELQMLNMEYEISTQREAVRYGQLFGVRLAFAAPNPLPSMEEMRERIDTHRRAVRSMCEENSVLRMQFNRMRDQMRDQM